MCGSNVRSIQIDISGKDDDVMGGVPSITVEESAQETPFYELRLWRFPPLGPNPISDNERFVEIAGEEFRMNPLEMEDR